MLPSVLQFYVLTLCRTPWLPTEGCYLDLHGRIAGVAYPLAHSQPLDFGRHSQALGIYELQVFWE